MSGKYKIVDNASAYFITMATVGWVLMHSHLHLICRAGEGQKLTDTLRDFKKFTSKKIANQIINEPESRRERL